ncbi:MAG: hypothetical protein ABWY16_14970, partial [Pedobacter sp.]|uniref:hypothetical protein n=1 Tax=Pedobacter sp. TaxID=1411316 RepID=UPI0033939C11
VRPAMIAEDVIGLTLNGLNAKVDDHTPALLLRGVSGLAITPGNSITPGKIRKEAVRPVVPDVAPIGGSHNQ